MISPPKRQTQLSDFQAVSIFGAMSRRANELGAINLGQGFPGFPPSSRLLDILRDNCGKVSHQYAPSDGLIGLREKISRKHENLYGLSFDPEHEITITQGATYGVFTCVSAFVSPGDRVVVIEPYYENYLPSVLLQGARPVIVPLENDTLDWKAFDAAFDPTVKAVIVNSPHNPSTKVMGEEFFGELAKRLRNTNALVFSDEVYEHLVFKEGGHRSVLSFEELKERCLAVFSFGKTYGVTGWKTGYVIAEKELTTEFRKAHSNHSFSVNPLIQQTLADFMDYPREYLELGGFYRRKMEFFTRNLASGTRFKPERVEGTFFTVADYGSVSELPDREFSLRMMESHGVGSIPMSAFYSEGYGEKKVRFCFAQDDEVLEKAIEALASVDEI